MNILSVLMHTDVRPSDFSYVLCCPDMALWGYRFFFSFGLSCFFFPLAQCLIYVQLPYMEDLRQYVFSSLKNSKKYIPTGKTCAGQLEK